MTGYRLTNISFDLRNSAPVIQRGFFFSMARTYLVFGDIEGKLDVLRVECTKCNAADFIKQRGAEQR